jgi:hypothetical protein
MSDPSALASNLTRALTTPTNGVLGLVDDLLSAARDHDLRLRWQAGQCEISAPKAVPPVRVEVPLPKSVVRAALARVAALCNERVPNSVTPYRGRGEVAVGASPAAAIHVRFVNTPDEQSLELSPSNLESTPQARDQSPAPPALESTPSPL